MAWVGVIMNALSCSDLYKYVFNGMRCKSDCCKHYLVCDCETDLVDIQSSDDEKKNWGAKPKAIRQTVRT